MIHPGALVGPGANPALPVIQQVSRVRVVVPVPEDYVCDIVPRDGFKLTALAYARRTFSGKVARG